MKYKVPFIRPSLPGANDIAEDYQKILDSNWFTNFGPYEKKFSHEAANYIGHDMSLATVSNATLGLILAIKALMRSDKIRKEVIVPSFTFAAGPEAILWCGLEPVFADVNKNSWQPDITSVEEYLAKGHKRVAGILFCNVFGVGAVNINEWEKLADAYKIPLVIDSAAGFGSLYSLNDKVGTRGSCEVFSFHATKPFAIGEGGAVSSTTKKIVEEIESLQNFGFNHEKVAISLGTNAKLQELNCAIGLRQLDGLDDRIVNRQNTLRLYKKQLIMKGYTFQENDELSTVVFASVLAPTNIKAEEVYKKLINSGVEVKRYYNPPLHQHPIFAGSKKITRLENTEDICSRILSLPVHNYMDPETVQYITDQMDW